VILTDVHGVCRMTKVMVGEACTPYMQAQLMSYLALGDAMGNIIGVFSPHFQHKIVKKKKKKKLINYY
jgi:hypothetical protein